jgi:Xaa-Pro dipeptidase
MTHPRVQTVLDIVKQAGVDAVALIPGANLQYITGLDFHLMERPLIVFFTPGRDPVAVLPSLEADRMRESGIPMTLFPWSDSEGYHGAFAAALNELKLAGKRLGVEELRMRVLEAQVIEEHARGLRIVPLGVALAELRLRKDADAVAHLREAIRISQDALQACIAQVRPGMTEREIAGILVVEQLKRGGGKHLFEPIVLSGPNSALPHGEPGDRRVAEGEPLLFDFGTTAHGYASDITRTFSVGEPSARLEEIYAIVKAANAAGRAAAGPGVVAQDVDRITRQVIENAGYGPYFTHRTGHGLGLEAHEGPNIVEGNTQILAPGMVFTIEPGIYIPGEVGVRIEDNMLITPGGAESLTTFNRDLIVIGK